MRIGLCLRGSPCKMHISELPATTQLLEGEDEPHTPQLPRLTVRQRQGKLDLSDLALWPPELVASAQLLLVEYHDVFLLEPGKMGCTHSTKHIIKVTDDTHSRNIFDGLLHLWWKRSIATCKRYWIWMSYNPARVHGVMWLC